MNCKCKEEAILKYKAPYELVKGHDTDSGYDIRNVKGMLVIAPRRTVKINTGVFLEIPKGYEVQVRPKSSLSAQGLIVHFRTVDEDYRGEVMVVVTNENLDEFVIENMQKVAQMVLAKRESVSVEKIDEISKDTSRADGAFGSTGRF